MFIPRDILHVLHALPRPYQATGISNRIAKLIELQGIIPQVSTRLDLSMEMSRLTRDGTVEPVSRDEILMCERGQGNINLPFSADHELDWQPYPVDPCSCYM